MTHTQVQLNAALAGRYTIERQLGAGGMATVYLAHDVRHHRKVALKLLRPELSAILGAERFLAEIKTTANLQHPHILSLFDSGEADGTVFYVMPYVEGETLRERIKREQQLPIDDALRIAREVLDALEYAHAHGIVHRDIKPENILLHGGHAMVADFGIALAASKVEGGTRMTETGMSLGTPHYMSPEQAMGERLITPKADIYAVGCVLYEMLTGEPPFTGASAQAIFARVLTDVPRSLTTQRRTIPANVESAVRMSLEKLPADRFASAAQFAQALANPGFATSALSAAAGEPARGATRRMAVVAGVAGVAGVAALAAGLVVGRLTAGSSSDQRPVHFTITLPESTTAVNRCCGRAQALAPDGSMIVHVAMRMSGNALYRRPMGQLESQVIPGTSEASIPFFSPDGQWLAFHSEGRLRKMPVAGGPATPIVSVDRVDGASWGDNDVIVYSSGGGKLFTVSAAGGQPTRVPTTDSVSRLMYPFMLPDGTRALAALRGVAGTGLDNSRIALVELQSGRVDTVAIGTRAEYADGYLVFGASDNTLLAQPFDPRRGRTSGQAAVMLNAVALAGNSNPEFSLSRNGWLHYLPGGSSSREQLAIGGGAGTTRTLALPGRSADNIEDPAISPDGRRVAVRLAGTSADGDLWVMDRQQETLTRFTVGGANAPVWSRDGRRIAYTVPGESSANPSGIYVQNANQTGTPQLVLAGPGLTPNSWTTGDRAIIFVANRGAAGIDVGMITLGDTTPRWLLQSQFNESWPQLSPDGRWLAYGSNRTGRYELYVTPFGGEAASVQVSVDGGAHPRWSGDGRTLYYLRGGALLAATLDTRAAISVTRRRVMQDGGFTDLNGSNVNWDLFPGGREYLYIDQQMGGTPRIAVIQNWPALVRSLSANRP